jgi:F0F1-type ATP synthase assembly protein I
VRRLTIWQALAISSQFGFLLAAAVLVGFGLGWLIDRWTGVGVIAYFVGATLGMVAGIYSMIKLVRAFLQRRG